MARNNGTPPPGRMPSSTAARVALSASSTRSFFSFTSTFARTADADDRDAARELGKTLLQLLAIVIRCRVGNLRLDLSNTRFDVGLEPAPSMIVVVSFSMRMRLARPSICSVTFSSLMPRSSEMS